MQTLSKPKGHFWSVATRGLNPFLLAGSAILVIYAIGFANGYSIRILTLSGVFAILVLGYQFIFGHAGALSLAQGALFGLGAYATGILGAQYELGFAFTFPISIAVSMIVAAIVAIPVLRLETHYFALATLGISQICLMVAVNWIDLTGGSNGIASIPSIVVFGFAVPRGIGLLSFIWLAVILFGVISWRLMNGIYGRAFEVARANDAVASAIGLNTSRLRFTAFLLSALYAGAAGAFYAHTIRVVSPDAMELPFMVTCMTMAVVGGRYRVAGAILGALLLIHLPEWFRFLERYNMIAYGLVLLFMVVLAPSGIVGLLEKAVARLRPPQPDLLPSPIQLPATEAASASPGQPVLAVENLSLSFGGVKAVNDVSFTIQAGEIVGLIGPNGSGKTTLINLISGFYKPATGSIRHNGMSLARLQAFRIAQLGIARTFQNLNLIDEMNAIENVAVARGAKRKLADLGSALLGRAAETAMARQEAMGCLVRLGVGELANTKCGDLAYGVRRKVEIARALALEPSLLLLDEPAAGLNPREQDELRERVRSLAAEGVTILVVEHNMRFLRPLADRMICLDQGSILASGLPEAVCSHPKVVEAYLGLEDTAA
ncbi:branched-chain amino acid ABC transporter ATP-binding protein/permease [Nitratireductor sp. StC3]|uniref:branched-chain amino acid ABC transporter ATP-binding protein/permease n=1 Tax=Nitratireductor sp. StC3 TaxID=2126741 RepID=UPI000D0DF6E5|nr:branched-chain amino acid ABC transporter ATP-binding protein/permease [Nitratireductor sp. StC3]PSM15827.1 ABC transporter ATP-binding protein [Nitratireductor sp. StC3]